VQTLDDIVATYTRRATGPARTVTVATTDPERSIAAVEGDGRSQQPLRTVFPGA
jgi:hypothetical protein